MNKAANVKEKARGILANEKTIRKAKGKDAEENQTNMEEN